MKKILLKKKNNSTSYIYQNDILWGILPNKILSFFYLTNKNIAEISDEQWQQILAKMHSYAYEKAISYLAIRERTRNEVFYYLKRYGFSEKIIEEMIRKVVKLNYLNEDRFTEMYCQDLMQKGKSKKETTAKLISKGVPANIIEKNLTAVYSEDAEKKIAETMFKKAVKKYQGHQKMKEKVITYMIRKGFSYDLVVNLWVKMGNEEKNEN